MKINNQLQNTLLVIMLPITVVIVLIVLYIIFTVSFQFVAKYLLQILSRRNILIRTEESALPQLGSKLQYSELFLVQKPVHYLNCQVAVQNQSVMLLDSNNKLLSVAKSEFNIKPGQQREFFYDLYFTKLFKPVIQYKKLRIQNSLMNNSVLYQNKVYFTVFDHLFYCDKIQIVKVAQIPNYQHRFKQSWNLANPGGDLFTIQDKLYVHNHSKGLYKLNGQKLQQVDNKHFNKYYYQFCDKVYCFDMQNIYLVGKNLKMKQIFEDYKNELFGYYYIDFIIHKGAIIVFKYHQPNGQQQYALNMIDGSINTTTRYFDIRGQFKDPNLLFNFGESGLQFNDEILTEMFGEGTLKQINEYYKAYSKHTNSCLDIALDYSKILFKESNQNSLNRYEKMCEKINRQLTGVNQRIQNLALLQQFMINKIVVDINAQ
ncbi:Hypothetical_protein [Hexamita inflata]|uniref:Hypothetical_protein n=1 Tax=Hexamita inflata TaxID=28002 RepID=A0AA86PAA6_9EUKA|nr:Hypothetical protein HINF_LOCUS16356 [Hexamita inflata]CAI9933873.1 Hypothetical protein HINF_LOCUS21518 [Hexamita inflata]